MKRNKTTKISRHKVITVNDLLSRDNVNELINEFIKVKSGATDAIIIYLDKDENWDYMATQDTRTSKILLMLEHAKFDFMSPTIGED